MSCLQWIHLARLPSLTWASPPCWRTDWCQEFSQATPLYMKTIKDGGNYNKNPPPPQTSNWKCLKLHKNANSCSVGTCNWAFFSHTHRAAVASWYYQSFFIHQLMHQWVVLKNSIKIYIKIDITTVPTCFSAVTPSSGRAFTFMLTKVTVAKIVH
jgi:hypothetical protein